MSEDMKPMQYEALIRAAHRKGDKVVSRYGVAGADADIYRRLERVAWEEPSDSFKLGVRVGEVATYIENALESVMEKYRHNHNEEFIEKIKECLSLLDTPSKEKIDECIDKAWEAFRSIGLSVS